MNTTIAGKQESSGGTPFGGFLDLLPNALYALVHVVFLAAGAWMAMRGSESPLAHPEVIGLYVASQVGFLAFFARAITLKMAVLIEQTLVFAMLLLVAI